MKVNATDVHDNTKTDVALKRQNFYGNLAGELEHENIYTTVAASELGKVSGFSTAIGDVPRSAKQTVEAIPATLQALREDPLGFLDGIERFIAVLQRAGVLDVLVEALIGPIERKQELNNPYDEEKNEQLHDAFAARWYQGYIGGKLATTVLSAGIGKAVKSSNTARKLGDIVSGTRTGRLIDLVNSKRAAVNRKVAGAVAKGAGKVGRGALSGAKTVGGTIRLYRLQRRADVDTSDLSGSQLDVLRGYLRRGGEAAARRLSRKDDDEIEDFTLGGVCPRATAANARAALQAETDCGLDSFEGVDADLDERFAGAFYYYDIDGAEFKRYLNNLSPENRKNVLKFASRKNGDYSGVDVVARVWKANKNRNDVISPEVLVENIKYLEQQGTVIKKGVYKGLTSKNPNDVKGSTYEVELGTEIEKRGDRGDVLYLDKDVRTSDGDIWVDKTGDGEVDTIIEAKNLDLKSDTYKKDLDFIFRTDFMNKIRIYKNAISNNDINDVNVVVSFRTTVDKLPKPVKEALDDAEDKYDVDISKSKDEEYVTSIRVRIDASKTNGKSSF